MYKLGFCIHGTLCRYRHKKEPGPPPSPADVVRSRAAGADEAGGAAGRHTNQLMLPGRADGGYSAPQHRTNALPLPARAPLDHHSGALVLQERGAPSAAPSAGFGGPSKVRAPPSGSARYFLINSSSRANLETAVRHGTWATSHRQNESKLNAAFDTSDNILLFFSVNESHHFQGVAQMVSRVGDQAAQAAANPQWQGQQGAPHGPRRLCCVC
jgi:cleavage and polyadenylation specificity factor subunit 4